MQRQNTVPNTSLRKYMATKNLVKKRQISLLLQNSISKLYTIIFATIFFVILCFSWISYCSKSKLFLPNIVSLILILLLGIGAYFLSKKFKINIKHFKITLFAFFIIIYIIQVIIILFAFFRTGWDAGSVNIISDSVVETGYPPTTGSDSTYLSRYPNNIFLVAILSLVKSIPILGDKYPFLLSINLQNNLIQKTSLPNYGNIHTAIIIKPMVFYPL